MTDATSQDRAATGGTLTTTVNRGWLIKFSLFALVSLVFGVWGLYDALVVYPARGHEDVKYQLTEYLELRREDAGALDAVRIAEPAARLAELSAREDELSKVAASAPGKGAVGADGARRRQVLPDLLAHEEYGWLLALKRVNELTPAQTEIADPRARLAELEQYWKTHEPPKPLASYDIPLQWGIAVIGFAVGAYLSLYIIRTLMTKYQYEPATQTLTLPGGRAIRPADLTDLDKRRWDKFYVTLITTTGPSVSLDVLRFVPLEDWVLAMEDTRFPDRAAERKAKAAAELASSTAPASTLGPGAVSDLAPSEDPNVTPPAKSV